MDDAERDRYLIKGTLVALGHFEIIEADHGEEALRQARSRKPDVIFLDLILPDMTGFEILDRLKSDADTRDIPVIINTSKILDETSAARLRRRRRRSSPRGTSLAKQVIAQVRESLSEGRARPPGLHEAES